MSDTPFMPLWVGDFLGDTQALDGREVGAYILILMALWQHDGELPADPRKLQRIARVQRNWPDVWASIEHYFVIEKGKISNRRLSVELSKVARKREVNAQNGARGGRAKSRKINKQVLANATNSLKQPYPEPYNPPNPPEGGPDNLEFLSGPDRICHAQAAAIRGRVTWQTAHISANRARELVAAGYLTEQECKEAGVL